MTAALIAQLQGVVAVAVYTLVASLIFWVRDQDHLRSARQQGRGGRGPGHREHGQVAYYIARPVSRRRVAPWGGILPGRDTFSEPRPPNVNYVGRATGSSHTPAPMEWKFFWEPAS